MSVWIATSVAARTVHRAAKVAAKVAVHIGQPWQAVRR